MGLLFSDSEFGVRWLTRGYGRGALNYGIIACNVLWWFQSDAFICWCDFLAGFEGDYCERDINECLQSPCQNGATCHNFQGSFRCNCSADTKGLLCQVRNSAMVMDVIGFISSNNDISSKLSFRIVKIRISVYRYEWILLLIVMLNRFKKKVY